MGLKKVKEAAYLTAENHQRYRAILRYFFIQHERMQEYIYPEEIYNYLKSTGDFSEFEEDSLYLDLDQLVRWGNLIPRQEMGSPRTIEEYKKKRFRYQPTPYTIEFERLLSEMENRNESFGGALERTQFDRVYHLLQELEGVVIKGQSISDEKASRLWDDLQNYFRQIVESTSGYIAYISSEEVEERMKTEAFLAYKDRFTRYLREFIRAMQSTSEQIKSILAVLSEKKMNEFFRQVRTHKSKALLEETPDFNESEAILEYIERWRTLQKWFRNSQSFSKSESEILLDRTTEAIRKITQVVQRMGERNQNFRSRREEYAYLAEWFSSLETIDDAHKLYSAAFGMDHTRHFFIDQNPTDNIYTATWECEPMTFETKPMLRTYRQRSKPGAVIDRSEKRKIARELYLKEKQLEREGIERHMRDRLIELDKVEIIEPIVRQIFLSWIGKAMGQEDQIIQTEFGMRVKVIMKEDRIVLRSVDGDLDMPNVTFELLEDKGVTGHA